MQYYGIGGKELKWFEQYLSDRKQCVSIDETCSDQLTVKSGVPQGSILGPLIFCIYINDLCNVKHTHDIKMCLYADDTAIFCKAKNINDLETVMQRQFTEICKWLDLNGLVLNAEKTKTLLFGTKKRVKNKTINIY